MEKVIFFLQWLLVNYQAVITALVAVISALIALFILIPGEQPEKFLQSCIEFLGKWSRKPESKE